MKRIHVSTAILKENETKLSFSLTKQPLVECIRKEGNGYDEPPDGNDRDFYPGLADLPWGMAGAAAFSSG